MSLPAHLGAAGDAKAAVRAVSGVL